MERTVPLILQWDENFDVGADTGTPVDVQDYQVPFKFTGTLNKLTMTINCRTSRRRTKSAHAGEPAQQPGKRVGGRGHSHDCGGGWKVTSAASRGRGWGSASSMVEIAEV